MTAGRAHRLRDHLRAGSASTFVWGFLDCSLWVCDWIAVERGHDPAARLRGTYHDEASCLRLLAREGGLVALASRLADESGLPETSSPMAGDVGVIETRLGPFLMISTGPRWACKTVRGVLFAPAGIVKAWSV
ncbi:DUF6950 family protein [Methylobacterium sp. E-045]|uniref:DUF6950 family protein n=1 Tax=Methylobacterium sp. E-045 TaxID=2836575 RepID=UPI001FBBA1C6|nr:hypothetical protein [Methylobacterium sp. E-045]MCJ2132447.1 hypothetical protein [Methylobacterium sp. E-045]